ncbi:DeoR/GlpR family DNA-binding transcription regulator [Acidocella sp. MX-AZ03]|uniref:DeoR/GlpR family DNA-binding transcription regulator n=1 Tax=Acidocella sp. MX-AZ03 TaxID=2697363 RepID=UPI0022DDACA8|nr:DeoR/GlpR family DNA-binding transcription regulator [Acidocella sp. MX-AZ03]WBO59209.1 DeoR/GlpR family DNA-binding transcription regulator [Acidocella sp. MX-AZ03]
MLTHHRHQEIMAALHQAGRVEVAGIATVLSVSEETIRRDMKLLEEQGLLRRIYGGAVLPRLDQDRPLLERGKLNAREKARVGHLAQKLVRDGMSIFIDSGTSTLALARVLAGRSINVTTNSINVALLLGDGPGRVNLTPAPCGPRTMRWSGTRPWITPDGFISTSPSWGSAPSTSTMAGWITRSMNPCCAGH